MESEQLAPAPTNAFPFDPRDPVFRQNPYPVYDHVRETTPVRPTDLGLFVLARHADCVRLLHDPETSVDQRNSAAFQAYVQATGDDPLYEREPSFLFLDPPDHTRLRGLVSHGFTPRRVRELGPRIEQLVEELLDEATAKGAFEVVEDFAYLIPVRVICWLLGVPPEDHEIFKDWSRDLARGLDPDFMLSEDTRRVMNDAGERLRAYFEDLIAQRRANPTDDMLSALVHAEDEGDKLTHGELLSTLSLLLIAGHETTVNLIANGILQFGRSPDQYAKLVADPGLARNAAEETLRFDPPVQITGRIALKDIDFDGHTLTTGNQAICLIGAANRDPEEFGETADRFDITRENTNHVSFGAGVHFCLGAPLARLEAQHAFAGLAKRLDRIELLAEPEYKEHFVLRGLAKLPVGV